MDKIDITLLSIMILVLSIFIIWLLFLAAPIETTKEYQGVYINGEKDYCRRGRCSFGSCWVSGCLSGNSYNGALQIKEIEGDTIRR